MGLALYQKMWKKKSRKDKTFFFSQIRNIKGVFKDRVLYMLITIPVKPCGKKKGRLSAPSGGSIICGRLKAVDLLNHSEN